MLKTVVKNVRDENELEIKYPCFYEDLRSLFIEKFGFCNASDIDDYVCVNLYSDEYCDEEEEFLIDEFEIIGRSLILCEEKFSKEQIMAFLEFYSYGELPLLEIDVVKVFTSKEEFEEAGYNLNHTCKLGKCFLANNSCVVYRAKD